MSKPAANHKKSFKMVFNFEGILNKVLWLQSDAEHDLLQMCSLVMVKHISFRITCVLFFFFLMLI